MSNPPPNRIAAAVLTRRTFVQQCALGAVALTIAPVLGGCAPLAAGSRTPRGPAHLKLALDRDWLFAEGADPAAMAADFDDGRFARVTLPHCVSKQSWQNWETKDWRKVWSYRRHFVLPAEAQGMRILAHFDGVMRSFSPVINGESLPRHHGGYLPARYELTPWIRSGDNVLAVAVDGRTDNVPPGAPDGSARIDYMEPAGIHRSVWLEAVPKVFVSDVFAKPVDVLHANRRLDLACTIDAAIPADEGWAVRVELREGARVIAAQERTIRLNGAGETLVRLSLTDLPAVKLWDVDSPNLHGVVVTLLQHGQPVHDYTTRVGFREARFKLDGFFLNGRRLQLFGLNRHELYPYVGYAMPARVLRRDAEILKHELNCNAVRCSHYPQSPAFLDACDELGMVVWEEIPGWQYIGDAVWQDRLVDDVSTMVKRDRNRPSIVIWGTRANESRSLEELYARTRAAARQLDDSRPVSGSMTAKSRKDWEKEWHEDVFAYDDYEARPDGSVQIREPVEGVPYMLAEAVGQFNYTAGSKFDSYYRRAGEIDRQCQQALRHAQAHSRAGENPRNCGVIAWCAFEYASLVNSYQAVKNPGVVDTFRIPKLGATFYLAQTATTARPLIEPNFYWDFNSQTPKGPGRGAAIFSNCDHLEVYIDDRPHATLRPDVANYPHLRHAPFFVDLELDGAKQPELRIDGYIGNQLALSRRFSSDPTMDRLILVADEKEVVGDGQDATRLSFRIVDRHGASRALAGGQVDFELTGPGEIVGDSPFLLTESGGAGAVWLKASSSQAGRVTVKATHARYGQAKVEVAILPAPKTAL